MATQTYQFKVGGQNGQTIAIKAKKDDAKRIANAIGDLFRLSQMVREYWTWYDKTTGKLEEHSSTMQSLFGPSGFPVREPEAFQAKRDAFMTKIAHFTITAESWATLGKELEEIIEAHIPINDKRKTIEQEQADAAAMQERQAELERERVAHLQSFLAAYGSNGEIERNPGTEQFIAATLTYDDSDMVSGYHAEYRTVPGTCDLALAIVSKRTPISEMVCRGIVARYPDLNALTWTWDKGHTQQRQRLFSNTFDYTDANGKGYSARWCVTYDNAATLPTFKGYGTQPTHTPSTDAPTSAGACKISRNYQHDGIELRFACKPDAATLDTVRALGFRFSFRQKIWYAKYSDALMRTVSERLEQCPMTPTQPDPEPGDMDTAHEDMMLDQIAANIGA